MKRLFRRAALLFYLLCILVFFFAGVYYAGITGKAEGQGLAAGAIVIGNGLIFSFVALIAGLFFVFYRSDLIKTANRVLFAALVLFVLITTWRFVQRQGELERDNAPQPVRPTTEAALIPFAKQTGSAPDTPMGLGMFKPDFYNQRVLYFYSNPNLRKAVNEHAPIDSLVFKQTERGVEISYAPPWFAPAHLKLDYDVLWMRAQSVGHEFVEVTVNETDGRSFFVNRFSGKLHHWPEFLLSVHAIELHRDHPQPVRIKPLEHASTVQTPFYSLQPQRVSGDWVEVEIMDANYTVTGRGWVRWRKEGALTVNWSLFS